MGRGDSSGELRDALAVLGDYTSWPGKRGLSCVSDDLGGKLCNRKEKSMVVGDGNEQFAKHVPFGMENSKAEEGLPLMKEKGTRGLLSGIGDVGFASENLIHYLPELPGENERHSHSCGDPSNVDEDNRAGSFLEGGDVPRDSCRLIIKSSRAQASGRTVCHVGDHRMVAIKVTPGSLVQEATLGGCSYLDCTMGTDGLFIGNITSSASGSIDSLKSASSLGSKNFDLKGDGCINQSLGDDLLNTCSCSFCLKDSLLMSPAAYIWSDLQYQDTRGRLAALGKSQREVASVIQRIDRAKSSVPQGQSSPEKTSKLESDLKNQWQSLFLHVQNALIQESSQSVSYLELKDLREKCKMDLEAINRTSSSRHEGNSDNM